MVYHGQRKRGGIPFYFDVENRSIPLFFILVLRKRFYRLEVKFYIFDSSLDWSIIQGFVLLIRWLVFGSFLLPFFVSFVYTTTVHRNDCI